MQVTETLNDGLKRGYAITVTAGELEAKVNEKLAEARPEIEMKGFRKGKVPMALLKKQLGQRLTGEAMQETIDGAMSKHFEDSGDRPAMQPEVKMTNEDWKEGDDVQVEMSYEKLPEIPEVDLKAITLEPGYALAYYNLAILYDLYVQRPELALENYQQYLSLEPDDGTAEVERWIADLRRRVSATPTTARAESAT